MEDKERINVFIKYESGRTACICMRNNKRCKDITCEREVVERDRYEGWEDLFYQDRYGRNRH